MLRSRRLPVGTVHTQMLWLVALTTWLAACGSPTETTAARRRSTPPPPAPTEAAPDLEQTGDEVEEEPAPDAATLANGRALAAPGRSGFLTTWRVLASGPPGTEPCAGDECPATRVVSFPEERIDLATCRRREGHTVVHLGAELLVPRDTRAYLMVGMRGAVSVLLDGEEIAAGESAERPRRDLVLAPLVLPEGEHQLTLRFTAPEQGRWRATVRWLDEHTRPGAGNVAIALGEIAETDAADLTSNAVRFDETHELGDEGPTVSVRAHLPGGALAIPVELTLGTEQASLTPEAGLHRGEVVVRLPMPERGVLDLAGSVGERRERFGRTIGSDRSVLGTAATLATLLEDAPERSRAAIDWRRREALRVVREHDADPRWRTFLTREARRIGRELSRERDPFATPRGYERMAFYSRLDGTPQEYEFFAPPGYRDGGSREWPLLITLHGYKGNAGDYFRNTFGLARNHEDGESLLAHGRHGEAPRSGPMFVIGPTGRGQSFYRHAGEIDIFEAMADVQQRYRIDTSRIYITGGSMGGTGAAYVPYRNPDVFAASVALAGYHDQRIRSDTNHEGLSAAEQFLEAHRSDVDWAENGLHLPTLLVRGTRDRPLAWTRVLVERLDELHYPHEHREPDSGHNVWTDTYAEGAIFRHMRRYHRPEHPRHVRLRTARERTRSAWWVRVEQRSASNAFAEVDARIEDGVVTATIEGAAAVTFSPSPPLIEAGTDLTVRIGGVELSGPVPLTIEANEDTWQLATHPWPEAGTRRPGVSGPIRDVYHEPLVFVVGTQDEDHTLINRLVAEHWAHPRGWIVDYPIVDDEDVSEAMMAENTLVLIGPPSSNAVHARIAEDLPIRVTDVGVQVAGETHRGPQVGSVFIAPNPEHPEHAVLVIAGPRPLGTWRANDLPDLLPDYVVYDGLIAHAHDRWACGGSGECRYLAHGLYDMHMRVPER